MAKWRNRNPDSAVFGLLVSAQLCLLALTPGVTRAIEQRGRADFIFSRGLEFGNQQLDPEDFSVATLEFVALLKASPSRPLRRAIEESAARACQRHAEHSKQPGSKLITVLDASHINTPGFLACVASVSQTLSSFDWISGMLQMGDTQDKETNGSAHECFMHHGIKLLNEQPNRQFGMGVLSQRPPEQRCFFTTRWCPMHPPYSSRIVESRRRDMKEHDQDQGLEAECLGRAQLEWQRCGSIRESPLDMFYVENNFADASTATFPELEKQLDPTRPDLSTSTQEGWKTVSVYVGDNDWVGAPVAAVVSRSDMEAALDERERQCERLKIPFSAAEAKAASAKVFGDSGAHELFDAMDNRKGFLFQGEMLQDWWVLAIFQGMKSGFFVDAASWDADVASNTRVLERDWGWQGLCVEANPPHWWALAHRKCEVVGAVIGEETGMDVLYDWRGASGIAGIVMDGTHNYGSFRGKTRRTVDIGTVLRKFQVPSTVHLLSLDVEGVESQILATWPFDRHEVLVIVIELPDLLSRSLMRRAGFFFLRDVGRHGGDEIWVHWKHPDFEEVMRRYRVREPIGRATRREVLTIPQEYEHAAEEAAGAYATWVAAALQAGPPWEFPLAQLAGGIASNCR
mmetsp:Transcript_33356/g.79485  ORF Transcript_33356/g.79485 Transcript_33356/m.79485 type:complete len:628 (-) Transcript_33356:257-2140(-)